MHTQNTHAFRLSYIIILVNMYCIYSRTIPNATIFSFYFYFLLAGSECECTLRKYMLGERDEHGKRLQRLDYMHKTARRGR